MRLGRQHLHERVAEELRDRIITCQLPPGTRLAVNELAEEIGVSLTPLREAIKLLASEHLIEMTPNRGARISAVTVEQTRHLFEVISGTEALAAELACKRMTDAELAELLSLHEEMQDVAGTAGRDRYFDLNRRIHDQIVLFARNPILADQRARLARQAERVRYIALGNDGRRGAAMQEHQELMRAFEARDPEGARRIWQQHLMVSGAQTIEVLAQLGG
ncbi:GntR family transcriptional regulator [Marinovum sp.]|uniref:GntR family transcriptional regulator n=1 Tax=Marinovum sp. TaxID=2024839 RepID=UPI002B279664|nr:GntR family transcriptional regulator [Marinovum sp.]